MRRRWLAVALLLLLAVAAAVALTALLAPGGSGPRQAEVFSSHQADATDSSSFDGVPRDSAVVTCRIHNDADQAIPDAACTYRFGDAEVTMPAPDPGARQRLPLGVAGHLTATAPGYLAQSRDVSVTDDVVALFILKAEPAGPTEHPTVHGDGNTSDTPPQYAPPGGGDADPDTSLGSGGGGGGGGGAPTWTRVWQPPVALGTGENEPQVVVDSGGTIYVAPLNDVYRSTDGGLTFTAVTPTLPTALPPLASDTAISVAPDGSLWFSRTWGYADSTQGCTSTDQGDSWTCDNNAIPGITDRMWIVGLSGSEGYVQTNEGLYHHQWAHTITGSLAYTPFATSSDALAVRNGNMVYDDVNGKVWQVEFVGPTLQIDAIDSAVGIPTSIDTGIPAPYTLPWIAAYNGVLWTSGETVDPDGSSHILPGRSLDGGPTWAQLPFTSTAASATFGYAGYGPGIHSPGTYAAVMYYGSDAAGPPTSNGGNWAIHVAHAEDADSPAPAWVDEVVNTHVHTGSLCIGLSCESSGPDPAARYAGDLAGAWVDAEGLAHIVYQDDVAGAMYQRQLWVLS